MSNQEVVVSIILPTYNGAHTIAASIRSVIKQAYTKWELLIIDDGSTDATSDIIADFFQDNRIKYLKNQTNLGIQKTLNKGMQQAVGKYIARIDNDDEWIDINKLQNQVSFLEEHSDYVLVGTGIVAVSDSNTELMRYIPPVSDKSIRDNILGQNCFAHSSVMFVKNKALALGGYGLSQKVRHVEDYDLWLRLGIQGKFFNLNTYSVKLFIHDDSLTAKNRIIQAKRAFLTALRYSDKYPNRVKSLSVSFFRLIFFCLKRILPIPQSFVIFLKKTIKNSK